ncbi:MAG: hypothetical protein V2I46_03335 [Bacteroides sp.]|jgi:hypothetical protein|nr:hypothetical protein [Bacteroides sp.]
MKKFKKKPFNRPNENGKGTRPSPGISKALSGKKEPNASECMPASFREMWDVFLSFTRLNY